MYSIYFISIAFALLLFDSVKGNIFNSLRKNMCDYDDNECLRRGSDRFYKNLIPGVPGVANRSDPLNIDEIRGQIPMQIKYRLINVTLIGLINCTVIHTIVTEPPELLYEQTLFCPKLVLNYNYEVKGKIRDIPADDTGVAMLTATNYVIIFIGKYGQFISKRDHKPHFSIIRNRIETDPRGKLLLDIKSSTKDKEETEKGLSEIKNVKTLEEILQCPIMTDLIDGYLMIRLDAFIRSLRQDQVFPRKLCEKRH